MANSTLIDNAHVMTMSNSEEVAKHYPEGAVLIEGDQIASVGSTEEVEASPDEVIDANGGLVLPGLINAHNHHEQSFMMAITRVFAGSTYEWIHDMKIPLTREMEPEDFYLSNLLACLHAIKSGVTCTANHVCQHDPNALEEYGLEETVRATADSGMRSLIPIGLADTFEPEDYLTDADRYQSMMEGALSRWNGSHDGRVKIWPGPPGAFSATGPMWDVAKAIADEHDVGIYTHLASAEWGEVEKLREYGALREDFVGAHCVWLTQEDIETMAKAGMSAIHNPTYKLGYSVDNDVKAFGDGIAPMTDLLEAGGTVGLGQDGCMGDTQDLFKEMRAFALTQHYRYRDKSLHPPTSLLEMATIENARALRWEDEIGSIEPGKQADLILLEMDDIKFAPLLNLPASIVYQATAEDVETVIIDGKTVMEGQELQIVDEAEIRNRIQAAATALYERADLDWLFDSGFEPWTSDFSLT